MKTIKVDIHQDSSCVWCEIDGVYIYAKDINEMIETFDKISEHSKRQYAFSRAHSAPLTYNREA